MIFFDLFTFYAPVTIVGEGGELGFAFFCPSIRPFITLYSIEFVLSTPPTVFNGSFLNLILMGHIEDMYMGFDGARINFDRIMTFQLIHSRHFFAL